jgi:hypothetical protein
MAKGNKAIHELSGKTDRDCPIRNLFTWTTGLFRAAHSSALTRRGVNGTQHRTEHLWFETPQRRDHLNTAERPAA